MGLFGNKKNKKQLQADTAEQGVEQQDNTIIADAKSKAPRGKKKKSGVGYFFNESVMGKVLEDFASNERFIITKDDQKQYVGLYLDTEDIGGFDKKAKKDEARGSIIEAINSGRIKALITLDLMEADCMVLIPVASTLMAMEEFSLLANAPYQVVYVSEDGIMTQADCSLTWKQASDIMTDESTILDALGLTTDESVSQVDIEYDDDDNYEDLPDDDDMSDNDVPFDNDSDDESNNEYDENYDNDVTPAHTVDNNDNQNNNNNNNSNGDNEENYSNDDEIAEEEEEIPDKTVQQAVIRTFYSSDLGLEVSTEPFDMQFIHNNDFAAFDENRGEGFLNTYLNQMSRAANIELNKMHNDNLFKIRERYLKLVAMYGEEIHKSLDTSTPDTQFGAMATILRKNQVESMSSIDDKVAKQKLEIETVWDQKLERVANDAARAARQQYHDRYGRQHEEMIYHIEPNIEEQIKHDYHDAMRQMNDVRRTEASKRLDYGINETLREISDIYVEMLDKEHTRHLELQEEVRIFVDDNRKDEITRVHVLDKELLQRKKADEVLADYTERLRQQSGEFEARRVSLQSEISDIQRRTADSLLEKETTCNDRVKDFKERNRDLQEQHDQLMKDYAALDDRKKLEYGSRITELKNDKTSLLDKFDNLINNHKRTNMISSFLVVVIFIAAASMGFIGGMYNSSKTAQQSTQAAVVQEFNDRANALDQTNTQPATTTVPTPVVAK